MNVCYSCESFPVQDWSKREEKETEGREGLSENVFREDVRN